MKSEYRKLIDNNIDKHGYHLYSIWQGNMPRYMYTIGLKNSFGFEILMAGCLFYDMHDAQFIFNEIIISLKNDPQKRSFELRNKGFFALNDVDESWTNALLFGAHDYFSNKNISCLQIYPDSDHLTIDVPDCRKPLKHEDHVIWRFLHEECDLNIPVGAIGVTNLSALKGHLITEVFRWEKNQWELFSGSGLDTVESDIRTIPVAILVSYDDSLAIIGDLNINEGIWRNSLNEPWQPWTKKKDATGD